MWEDFYSPTELSTLSKESSLVCPCPYPLPRSPSVSDSPPRGVKLASRYMPRLPPQCQALSFADPAAASC